MSARRATPPPAAPLIAVLVLLGGASCSGEPPENSARSFTTTAPTAPTSTTTSTTGAGPPALATDAADLAADVYVAGYPLVVSQRTLQRFAGLIGINTLFWQQELSGPDNRLIVAPNRDTLYSVAVLDLRAEPMTLTVPEIRDRYYTYQFLDTWTESFAYVGTRATGGRAGTWAVTPPGWDGALPDGVERIEAATRLGFLLGRFLVEGDADVAKVVALGEQVALRPLSTLTGEAPPPPPPPLGEPPGPPQQVPTDASFFAELNAALASSPAPTRAQRDLLERAAALGIGAGRSPSDDVSVRRALEDGATVGAQRIASAALPEAERASTWVSDTGLGRYADDLLLRARVARVGWGANVPAEAIYAAARADGDGAPLEGKQAYRITWPSGELPPVDGFWSLTVYGADMFFVEHPSGRYSIGDRTPGLVYGENGSLTVTLSHSEPAATDASALNWLPVPEGRFVLMLRLYLPHPEVVSGEYAHPPIERIDT